MNVTNIDKLPPVAQLLAKARAVILDTSHWTQATLAERADGYSVNPNSRSACRWCALGAVEKAAGTRSSTVAYRASSLLDKCAFTLFGVRDEMDVRATAIVNDDHGHEAAIQLYDFAIGEAVKEGL